MRVSGTRYSLFVALLRFSASLSSPLARGCQVVGDWTFHRTKANSQAKDMSTCNRAGSYLGGGDFGLGEPNYEVHDKVKVSLSAPNKASAVIDGKKVEGSWTMMYDEGFEVNLAGAKVPIRVSLCVFLSVFFSFAFCLKLTRQTSSFCASQYFAFSKYTGEKHNDMSHCDKTFPGWYHGNPEKTSWGCYHGVKDTKVRAPHCSNVACCCCCPPPPALPWR